MKMSFLEFHDYIKTNFPVYSKGDAFLIDAVYVRTLNELEIVKRYFTTAHSFPGMPPIYYRSSVWKGPDWYFDVYEEGSREGPGIAYLKSLTEKKEEFEALCHYLDILVEHA